MFISVPELNIRPLNYCSAGEAHERYLFIKRQKRQEIRRKHSERERKPMMLPGVVEWRKDFICFICVPLFFFTLTQSTPPSTAPHPHTHLVRLPRPSLFFSEPKILIVPTVIYQSGTLFFNRQKKKKKELIDAASCKGIISQGYPFAKGGGLMCTVSFWVCVCWYQTVTDSSNLLN